MGSPIYKFRYGIWGGALILGTILGILSQSLFLPTPYNLRCVSNPINELVTQMQKAQAGITTGTDSICMNAGEQLSSSLLTAKLTTVGSTTFKCDGYVCKNNNPLDVSDENNLRALSSVRFKGVITCTKTNTNDYRCEIAIQSV